MKKRNMEGAEQPLPVPDAMFRAFFDSLPLGAAIAMETDGSVHVNGALGKFLGYDRSEMVSCQPLDFVRKATHPDDYARDMEQFNRLVAGEIDHYQLDKRFVTRDGRTVWGKLTVLAVRDSGAKPVCVCSVIQDITAQKRAEEGLRAMSMFPRHDPGPLVRVNDQGVITSANPAAVYLGAGIGGYLRDLIPGMDEGRLRWCIPAGHRFVFECGLRERTIRFVVQGIPDLASAQLYGADMTESQRIKERTQAMGLMLERMFASLDEAVFVLDADTRLIVACNAAAERTFGHTRDEMVGRNTEFLHVDRVHYEDFGTRMFSALDRDGIFVCEFQVRRKDGTVFVSEHTVTGIHDAEGRRTDLVSVVRDVTRRHRLEREILLVAQRERERMRSDLHDSVSQELAGIGFLLQKLRADLARDARAEVQIVDQIGALLDETAEDVHAVARGVTPVSDEADSLADALEDLVQRVGRLFPVACLFERRGAVPVADSHAANQLFFIAQEAATNAARHAGARRIDVSLALATDGDVVLTVRDDGRGFTTKDGAGGGLGLGIMDYRAGAIGATLDIRSTSGVGTTVVCRWNGRTLETGDQKRRLER